MFRLLLIILLVSACKKSGSEHDSSATKFATIPQEQWLMDIRNLDLLIAKVHRPRWKIIYGFDYSCAQSTTNGLLQFDDGKKSFYVTPTLQTKVRNLVNKSIDLWLKALPGSDDKLISVGDLVYEIYSKRLEKDDNYIERKFSGLAKDDGDLRIIFTCNWPDSRPRAYWKDRTIFSPIAVTVGAKSSSDKHQQQELEDLELFFLIHEVGHLFGLSDTYVGGDHVAHGMRSASVMSSTRFYNMDRTELVLAEDDIKGIRWLYKLYRRQVGKQDCPAGYQFLWNGRAGTCRPSDFFMHNIKSAHQQEKNHRNLEAAVAFLSSAIRALLASLATDGSDATSAQAGQVGSDVKVTNQDADGNTPLHHVIRSGAWSLFNSAKRGKAVPFDGYKYAMYGKWAIVLTRLMQVDACSTNKSLCIDINKQNNDGYTPLHYAVIFTHSEAVASLMERKELDLTIKDNRQRDVCFHAYQLKEDSLTNEAQQLRDYLGLTDKLIDSLNPWSDHKREREMIVHYLSSKCPNLN